MVNDFCRFKAVNDGNYSKGIQDVEEFCILMANQVHLSFSVVIILFHCPVCMCAKNSDTKPTVAKNIR